MVLPGNRTANTAAGVWTIGTLSPSSPLSPGR